MSNEFQNKTAIVTGSTQGIGYAVAKLYIERGLSNLTIVGRDESKGAKKAAGKKAYSGNRSSAQGRGNASKRADGIAQKGHTRGRHV